MKSQLSSTQAEVESSSAVAPGFLPDLTRFCALVGYVACTWYGFKLGVERNRAHLSLRVSR